MDNMKKFSDITLWVSKAPKVKKYIEDHRDEVAVFVYSIPSYH